MRTLKRSFWTLLTDRLHGRFGTRYQAAVTGGLNRVQKSTVEFAFEKLMMFSPNDLAKMANISAPNTRSAPLSVRLLLEFDISREKAREVEMELVARNMRIVYSVPSHREYLRAGTPSEPILAEAAAVAMNRFRDALKPVECISGLLESGLIDKGSRGELVARLLLTLAHDAAVWRISKLEGLKKEDTWWSRPVLLVDFLRALFADDHHSKVLHCTPDNIRSTTTLEQAFEGAYIHFTHFALMGEIDTIDTHTALAGLVRGIAWQVAHTQKDIDIAIPVVMKNEKLVESLMTYVLIQVKNRTNKQHIAVDAEALGILPKGGRNPYIVLDMQLGVVNQADIRGFTPGTTQQPGHTRTLPREGADKVTTNAPQKKLSRGSNPPDKTPRYRISAHGCSSSVYAVVGPGEKDVYAGMLAARTLLDEHPRQENLPLVRRLKPDWVRGCDCFDWIEDTVLQTPKQHRDGPTDVGVMVGNFED